MPNLSPMSFNFTAVGASKEETLAAVKSELALVLAAQPGQKKLTKAINAAVAAMIEEVRMPTMPKDSGVGAHIMPGMGAVHGTKLSVHVNATLALVGEEATSANFSVSVNPAN